MLTYATVCSGIECMSVACRGLPLKPVFFSEIEPYPCAVLRAHYPDVPNLGDMSKISVTNQTEITNGTRTITLGRPLDILAGGTPCQDVSVAGKRRGFDPEGRQTRSSLAFDFVRLARELGPRYVLWENVAGSIDSKNGPDFLKFLSALGDCGYSIAWRVLDAQYVTCSDIYTPDGRVDVPLARAVPQRRRRVWVVGVRSLGCAGANAARAAAILFEPDRSQGNSAPRRRTRQDLAASSGGCNRLDAGMVGCPPGVSNYGETGRGWFSELPVAETLRCEGENRPSRPSNVNVLDMANGDGVCIDNSTKGAESYGLGHGSQGVTSAPMQEVQPTLCSDDYKGPLPGVVQNNCVAIEGNGQRPSHKGTGYNVDGVSFTLNHVEQHAVAVQTANTGANGSNVSEDGAAYTIDRAGPQSVAIGIDQQGGKGGANTTEGVAPTVLSDSHGTPHGVAYECDVNCYENHAQDSRIQGPIQTAPTQGSSNANSAGISGNNPLVVHSQVPFVKTAHARGKDGLGEKWEECEVAGTRNAIEGADGRNQECIVSMAQNTREEVRVVGDGKVAGALSAEAGTHQQTYLVSTVYKLDSTAANSMKSANPNSGIHEEKVSACLDTTVPDPSKNQGGNVIVQSQGLDGYNQSLTGDVSQTIRAKSSDTDHLPCVVSTNSNGEDVAATLTSTDLVKRLTGENDRGGGYVISRTLGIGRDVIECGKAAKFAPDVKDECCPTIRAKATTNGVCIVADGEDA